MNLELQGHRWLWGALGRLLLLGLLAFALAVFAACGDDDDDGGDEVTVAPSSSGGATEEPAETGDSAGDGGQAQGLQVGVMTAVPITVGTWEPAHNAAYTAVGEQYDWDITIAEAIPYGEAEQALSRFGDDGMDVVFVTDQGFEQSFLNVAELYPDTKFIMMSDLSETRDLPNVAAFTFDFYQVGCLAGAAAALVSETHEIGGISGEALPAALLSFGGGQFCAEEVAPGTTLNVDYTHDWVDSAKAGEVTSAMLADGNDAFFGLLGGTTPGVVSAITDGGGWYIGWLVDESSFGPEVTPTSVVVNFQQLYENAAAQLDEGALATEVHRGTIEDGTITVLPLGLGFEDRDADLQGLVESIKNGELELPGEPIAAP